MKQTVLVVAVLSACSNGIVGVDHFDAGPDAAPIDATVIDAGGDAGLSEDANVADAPADGGLLQLCGEPSTWSAAARTIHTGDPCASVGGCYGPIYLTDTDLQPVEFFGVCVSSTAIVTLATPECGTNGTRQWEASDCEELLTTARFGDPCVGTGPWACMRASEGCCYDYAACRAFGGEELPDRLGLFHVCNNTCDYSLPGGRVHDHCPTDGDYVLGEACTGDWFCSIPEDGFSGLQTFLMRCDAGVLRVVWFDPSLLAGSELSCPGA